MNSARSGVYGPVNFLDCANIHTTDPFIKSLDTQNLDQRPGQRSVNHNLLQIAARQPDQPRRVINDLHPQFLT